ncbi:MAG TPA: TIGR04190 family B12-binding domain/radical SAM domain protein [Thermoanaerobaculia bacterium]|nr:TIGR04190 family B12-binding domain/radical SAM domain protein [Thermoanaerobaculia bacterium]
MRQPDVVLIHPPSVFDFRERACLYGPVSDVIPSSPVFEMYPVGFLTLAAYLRRHGYRVRIVNLALLMMRSRRFDPGRFLRRLRPQLFGIDLHWLPHVHGALALAALLERIHPDIPIVFGGISATYFHQELIREASVDFVLRGAVTEPSLLALVRELEGARRFASVPGLTWKDAAGLRVNADAPATTSLDDYGLDLGMMVSTVVRSLDFWTNVPFHSWWRHPITAVFTVKGCARGCATCGASRPAFHRFMPGCFPILRSPGAIAQQVRQLAAITRAPIFFVGDLRDGGAGYVRDVLAALARTPVSNRLVFELFDPPDASLVAAIDASVRHWGAELSPESHDEAIRARLGKARFSNGQMETAIEALLASRCEALDLFYMIGLPGQTHPSVLEMVDAIERLFARFDRRLSAFITPMGPFLDPGSTAFEHAEERGYRLRAHTLAEHRALLEQNDWESILNYETRWMTRADIVDATYDAAERLNALKLRYGRIDAKTAAGVCERLTRACSLRQKLLHGSPDAALDRKIREASEGTVNDKAELFAPAAFLRNFRIGGILRLLAREWIRAA